MSSFWLDPWIKSAWEEQCIWNLSLWMHNKRQSPIFACKIASLSVLYWAYLMYQIYRMHHMNQTHHKTYQIWNGLRTHCPHVKTAQTESDDMWSKDSSLVAGISTFLWSVNAKAIQQTHRRWHVKLYVERAFICREGISKAGGRMSGRRRAFSGSPVSRSRAVQFSPPRSHIHLSLGEGGVLNGGPKRYNQQACKPWSYASLKLRPTIHWS